MTVVAVVQARMGSTRLPGKVLLPAPDGGRPGGTPLLGVLLRRLARADTLDRVVVAVPNLEQDDVLAQWVFGHGHRLHRGSARNVLRRTWEAASPWKGAKTLVVRVTGDCPLVDPVIVDRVVRAFRSVPNTEYLRTGATYPEGLDVEVFTWDLLDRAHKRATLITDREHVTSWMRPLASPPLELPRHHGHIRVTVDEPEDYQVVCDVLRLAGEGVDLGGLLALYAIRPEVFAPNASIERNAGYRLSLRKDRERKREHSA